MASFYQDGVTAELRVPELNPVNGQPSPLYFHGTCCASIVDSIVFALLYDSGDV
jgi:hypothetical protein